MEIHNRTKPIKLYRKSMLSMLKDFCIDITPEVKRKINSIENEIEMENYCNYLIMKYFEERGI